jgi:uncharacterized metal-binding protein YceD (DUF177 family)
MSAQGAGIGETPEFSRIVSADDIGVKDVTVDIEAQEAERAALAERFELIAIDSLRAHAVMRRAAARDGSGTVLRVTLDIDADVVQRCVVSLEPVPAQVHEAALIVEYRLGDETETTIEVEILPEGIDPPEILVDGKFDLGELAAEHLALALDPYPKVEGVAVETSDATDGAETVEPQQNPFSVLRDWPARPRSDGD